MKSHIRGLFFTVLVVASVGCSVPIGPDNKEDETEARLLPLAVGSSWALESRSVSTDGQPRRDTLSVFGTARIEGNEYFLFGEEHAPQYLRTDERGRTMSFHQGVEKVLFWDITDSNSYEYPYGTGQARAYTVTIARGILVETLAGVFSNCVRFTFDDPGARDDRFSYTLAPGVGIVARDNEWWGEWVLAGRTLPD